LVDSGSGPNIIKKNSVTSDTPVDRKEVLKLSGITTHHVPTLGKALIDILGCPVAFHVVENDFPIPQHGILGSDFFKQFRAKVDYELNQLEWNDVCIPFGAKEEILTIPPRAISTMHIKVANPELTQGYVPRLRVTDGIYLGEALVTVKDAKAYLLIINTTNNEERIYVPTVTLREFDISTAPPYPTDDEITGVRRDSAADKLSSCFHINEIKRESKVIDLLRLDHLNPEERKHVETLVAKNADCFFCRMSNSDIRT